MSPLSYTTNTASSLPDREIKDGSDATMPVPLVEISFEKIVQIQRNAYIQILNGNFALACKDLAKMKCTSMQKKLPQSEQIKFYVYLIHCLEQIGEKIAAAAELQFAFHQFQHHNEIERLIMLRVQYDFNYGYIDDAVQCVNIVLQPQQGQQKSFPAQTFALAHLIKAKCILLLEHNPQKRCFFHLQQARKWVFKMHTSTSELLQHQRILLCAIYHAQGEELHALDQMRLYWKDKQKFDFLNHPSFVVVAHTCRQYLLKVEKDFLFS